MTDREYKAKLALQELMAYLEDENDQQLKAILKKCRPLIEDLRPSYALDDKNNWHKI
jgi:hypothetical protein